MVLPLLLFFLSSIQALPDGAPTSACQTMMPFHGGGIEAQREIPPYFVKARKQGEALLVSIGSSLGTRFQGFMVQARTPAREVLGQFNMSSTSVGHTIDCTERADTITHNSPDEKETLDVMWIPPPGYEGPIIFNATIVQRYDFFWLGVESPIVQIARRAVDDFQGPPSLHPNRPITHTSPYSNPEKATDSFADFDPFYDGCLSSKLCFGAPENCVSSKSCKAVVAVTVSGVRCEFELKADGNATWMRVRLSGDDKMGDETVIECVRNGNGVATYIYSSGNLSDPHVGIRYLNSSAINGALYCKVRRYINSKYINSNVNENNLGEFNLGNKKYNLLVASAASATAQPVSFRGLVFLPSSQSQSVLSDVSALAGASKLLVRLHGSFMLAAWIGTASLGILLARYYRQTWVGTTLMGKDLWFALHRIFMVLTWSLTMAAFILIFAELKEWSREKNPHAILGTITTILCFFQPIGAYFRPHPGSSTRPIFNWVHWLIGNVAHIIAIVTIFFAVKLTKAELPEFVDWILMAYVVVHFITHLLLSVMDCISEKSSESRGTLILMKDIGDSGRHFAYEDQSSDAQFSGFRKFLLGVYIFIILNLVLTLIAITLWRL